MDITLRIRRFNPENDKKPYWGTYTLKDCQPTNRVLDMLHRVKWEQDGTLTLRRSCAQGICGSDAMRINGRNRLACKVLLSEFGENHTIQIEPILGLKVIKDLIVDFEPFFAHYRSVMPYFVNDSPVPVNADHATTLAIASAAAIAISARDTRSSSSQCVGHSR